MSRKMHCDSCGKEIKEYYTKHGVLYELCNTCAEEVVKEMEDFSISFKKRTDKENLREAYEKIVESYDASEYDLPAYCIYCDEMIEEHKEDCVVLKAEKWLKDNPRGNK